MKLKLRLPIPSDERSFRAAVKEFRDVDPGWEFAFSFDERRSFEEYTKLLEGWVRGEGLEKNHVPNTFFVAVVGDKIVGRVSIRHELNEFLLREGGHIGYGVVPSERRKGYASEILRQSLLYCKKLGIPKVLVTCDDNNMGSWKVIEANKGLLENILPQTNGIGKRRYWISL